MFTLTPARQAILATINWAEGTPRYDQLFAYVPFNPYGPHPNEKIPFGNTYSTAAGAYQFLYTTWQDTIKKLGIADYMSPENQDQAALQKIQDRGALSLIDSGTLSIDAMDKLSYEWASFPTKATGTSRYGQGGKKQAELQEYFNQSLAYYNGQSTTGLNVVAYNVSVKKKRL